MIRSDWDGFKFPKTLEGLEEFLRSKVSGCKLPNHEQDMHIWTNPAWELSWEEWDKLTEDLTVIDFGCGFENGRCAGRSDSHTGGCCDQCRNGKGFLDSIKEEDIPQYLSLWDNVRGFWKPGGCSLPRRMRSIGCLVYSCRYTRKNSEASIMARKMVRERPGTLIQIQGATNERAG